MNRYMSDKKHCNISPTLRSKMIIEEMKAQGKNIYNFGLGENSVKQSSFFIEKMKEFAHKKHYASCEGIPSLNTTLKTMYNNEIMDYEVLVGNGLKELLFICQFAFKGKIIHVTPSWVSYKEHIDVLEREECLIELQTKIEDNFHINLQELETILKTFEKQPKMLLLNNPNNPTGICYSNDELKSLAAVLKKYNCMVFSDEIYLQLCHYEGQKSIRHYIPELTLCGSSVSKDLACGGYRLGWVAFPKTQQEFFDKCKFFSSRIYSCAPVPIQYATDAMLCNRELYLDYAKKTAQLFTYVCSQLLPLFHQTKLVYSKTNASWYSFVDFSNYKVELDFKGIHDSIELADFLLQEYGIVSVAGQYFNHSSLSIRLSFVDFEYDFEKNDCIYEVDLSKMKKGIEQIILFVQSLEYPL